MERFYVDERGGCVAVRDKDNTDPDYPGLHSDTAGVVCYWGGMPMSEKCPTCRHERSAGWKMAVEDIESAHKLAAKLNLENDTKNKQPQQPTE